MKASTSLTEEDFLRLRKTTDAKIRAALDLDVDSITVFGEDDFPAVRGSVAAGDYPVALVYRGNLELLDSTETCVAVIGHLNPTKNVLDDEHAVVRKLVNRGTVIVSGLARGCDAQAHLTALEYGGKTVAILPSTLSNIYPNEHSDLAQRIVKEGGLLISEYLFEPESSREQVGRFVRRDRLQALFSDLVILTASYAENTQGLDSGSRHALIAAKKYGIGRSVLPDRSPLGNDPQYALNRQLLADDDEVFEMNPDRAELLEIRSAVCEPPANRIADATLF